MGGTLAGLVMSQLAIPEHPLFYIGFPITPAGNPFYAMAQAYANGHPYILVDENNPSEKVAAEKLLGVARTGGALPVTFTASQGWRLFAEIMPQLVGARLECLFVLCRRALAAPALNIEESHTDFMTFRDDGAIMLSPKSTQEFVPCLYLARLLTHWARLPVVASLGGITDTHKIGLVKVPPDREVQAWLAKWLRDFDFLEDKLLNRQGGVIVHGPSATNEHYQETQSPGRGGVDRLPLRSAGGHRYRAGRAPHPCPGAHRLLLPQRGRGHP
jgi:pyruvate/2-oxoacid:ferredoxin oxidoreductase alpha subunit